MYKEYTCFIYSLYISRTSEHALKSWKLWSVGKTLSVVNLFKHLSTSSKLHTKTGWIGPWLSVSSPPCQGKHVNSWAFQVVTPLYLGATPRKPRFLSMKSHPEFWGFLGICTREFWDLHRAFLGLVESPKPSQTTLESKGPFLTQLGRFKLGVVVVECWDLGSRVNSHQVSQRLFGKSCIFGGEGCSIEKQWVENAFKLSSQAVIFSLICQYLWNNRFLAINLRKKIHNHCPTPTVFMVVPMLILSLLVW